MHCQSLELLYLDFGDCFLERFASKFTWQKTQSVNQGQKDSEERRGKKATDNNTILPTPRFERSWFFLCKTAVQWSCRIEDAAKVRNGELESKKCTNAQMKKEK